MKTFTNNVLKVLAATILSSALVSCGAKENSYTPQEFEAVEYNGSIRISLTHPFSKKAEDYELLLASSLATRGMGVCVDDEFPDCKVGAPGFHAAKPLFTDGNKVFFKTNYSALLEDGLVINILSFDAAGAVIDQRKVKFEKVN